MSRASEGITMTDMPRDRLIAAIEAAMPADTVWTKDYGRVGIAPDVGDLADALIASGIVPGGAGQRIVTYRGRRYRLTTWSTTTAEMDTPGGGWTKLPDRLRDEIVEHVTSGAAADVTS